MKWWWTITPDIYPAIKGRPKIASGLGVLLFSFSVAQAQESPSNILYASLAGVQVQEAYETNQRTMPSFGGEFLSFGLGRMWGDNGFLAATRLFELYPSGENGDYMFAAGLLPIYVYAIHGVPAEGFTAPPRISLHAFAGGAAFAMYNLPYIQAGVGTKCRLAVFSPELLLSWRHVWARDAHTHHDFISAGLKLELGGWWRLGNAATD